MEGRNRKGKCKASREGVLRIIRMALKYQENKERFKYIFNNLLTKFGKCATF